VSTPHPLDKEELGRDAKPVKAESVGAKKVPLYEHNRPHKLDGSIATAVFLRRLYERGYVDDDLKGDARRAKVVFATDDASELVKEIVAVSHLDKPNWGEVATELAHALRTINRLETEASAPEKARLTSARKSLQSVVDKEAFAAAEKALPTADKLPQMNEKERLEMAAQAIIAACRQSAEFKKAHAAKAPNRAQAREHFMHLQLL